MTGDVLVTVDAGVAWLTLNLPDSRNPISAPGTVDAFVGALRRVDGDPAVRVAVLTGAGRAFSAGGDVFAMEKALPARQAAPGAIPDQYRRGIQRIPRAIEEMGIPVIAAVNGAAVGAGCDLACMCDVRIASEHAKFAESFVRLALVPGDGGAWYLQRIVGYAKAMEMTVTGEPVDAQTAFRLGLVSAVVPADRLLAEAGALAAGIAAMPASAVRATKRLMRFARDNTIADTLEMSAQLQALAHTSTEHGEAVEAAARSLRASRRTASS